MVSSVSFSCCTLRPFTFSSFLPYFLGVGEVVGEGDKRKSTY